MTTIRDWIHDHCTRYVTTDGRFRIGAKIVDGSLCIVIGHRGFALHRSWRSRLAKRNDP